MNFNEITESLGRPDFSSDGVAIYHANSLEALSQVPAGSIDLTVTSPPYNIGKEYEVNLALDKYLDWSKRWMHGVHEATAAEGAMWLNLGYIEVPGEGRAVPLPYLLWNASPFYLLQEVVWNYGAGVSMRKTFSARNEKFLWYVKSRESYVFNLDAVRDPDVKYPNQKKNGKLRCNPLGKNPGDVWSIPKVTSGTNRSSKERTPHPAQFPEAVIERVILASSNEGDVVLDPFMGSGTTAVVAQRLGRKCVGFELREDYVELSARRVTSSHNARVAQLPLAAIS